MVSRSDCSSPGPLTAATGTKRIEAIVLIFFFFGGESCCRWRYHELLSCNLLGHCSLFLCFWFCYESWEWASLIPWRTYNGALIFIFWTSIMMLSWAESCIIMTLIRCFFFFLLDASVFLPLHSSCNLFFFFLFRSECCVEPGSLLDSFILAIAATYMMFSFDFSLSIDCMRSEHDEGV